MSEISPDTNPAWRATRLYTRAAWALLLFIGLGYVTEVPAVSAVLDNFELTFFGRCVITGVIFLMVVVALTLWFAAIWYVRVSPDVVSSRTFKVCVLLWANFAGAFLYYWFAVHWRSSTRAAWKVPSRAPHER